MITFDRNGQQANNVKSETTLIPYNFKLNKLNSYIGYLFRQSKVINRRALRNMQAMFNMGDDSFYRSDEQRALRVILIKRALEGRVDKKITNFNLLLDHCMDGFEDDIVYNAIVENIEVYKRMSQDDLMYINNDVANNVRLANIVRLREKFRQAYDMLDTNDYNTLADMMVEFNRIGQEIIDVNRKTNTHDDGTTFSLDDPDMVDHVIQIADNLKNPKRRLTTGIRALNDMLVGGYQAGRLYVYMGLPAGFKSGMLLKTAQSIKLYNDIEIDEHDPKTPTVLMVTMENTVEESVERLFNISGNSNSLEKYSKKDIINILKKNGSFTMNKKNDINIVIKYYTNQSISTDDLYSIIEDVEDQGREVIALILDYIKRIRPAKKSDTEKEELKNVTNELKAIAQVKDIPVITAHQLNREAANMIDSALQSGKTNVGRNIGRGQTGSAWEVMENVDWAAVINVEKKRGTQDYFLSVKRVKLRYRDYEIPMEFFNHPFAAGNRIMLLDDVNHTESISIMSIDAEMDSMSDVVAAKNFGKLGAFSTLEQTVMDLSSGDVEGYNPFKGIEVA